jgi:hypothetical protein
VGLPVFLIFNGSGFVTTAVGALGTWLGARRYEDLSRIFTSMQRQLQVLAYKTRTLDLTRSDADSRWSQLVDEVETLLEGDRSLMGGM